MYDYGQHEGWDLLQWLSVSPIDLDPDLNTWGSYEGYLAVAHAVAWVGVAGLLLLLVCLAYILRKYRTKVVNTTGSSKDGHPLCFDTSIGSIQGSKQLNKNIKASLEDSDDQICYRPSNFDDYRQQTFDEETNVSCNYFLAPRARAGGVLNHDGGDGDFKRKRQKRRQKRIQDKFSRKTHNRLLRQRNEGRRSVGMYGLSSPKKVSPPFQISPTANEDVDVSNTSMEVHGNNATFSSNKEARRNGVGEVMPPVRKCSPATVRSGRAYTRHIMRHRKADVDAKVGSAADRQSPNENMLLRQIVHNTSLPTINEHGSNSAVNFESATETHQQDEMLSDVQKATKHNRRLALLSPKRQNPARRHRIHNVPQCNTDFKIDKDFHNQFKLIKKNPVREDLVREGLTWKRITNIANRERNAPINEPKSCERAILVRDHTDDKHIDQEQPDVSSLYPELSKLPKKNTAYLPGRTRALIDNSEFERRNNQNHDTKTYYTNQHTSNKKHKIRKFESNSPVPLCEDSDMGTASSFDSLGQEISSVFEEQKAVYRKYNNKSSTNLLELDKERTDKKYRVKMKRKKCSSPLSNGSINHTSRGRRFHPRQYALTSKHHRNQSHDRAVRLRRGINLSPSYRKKHFRKTPYASQTQKRRSNLKELDSDSIIYKMKKPVTDPYERHKNKRSDVKHQPTLTESIAHLDKLASSISNSDKDIRIMVTKNELNVNVKDRNKNPMKISKTDNKDLKRVSRKLKNTHYVDNISDDSLDSIYGRIAKRKASQFKHDRSPKTDDLHITKERKRDKHGKHNTRQTSPVPSENIPMSSPTKSKGQSPQVPTAMPHHKESWTPPARSKERHLASTRRIKSDESRVTLSRHSADHDSPLKYYAGAQARGHYTYIPDVRDRLDCSAQVVRPEASRIIPLFTLPKEPLAVTDDVEYVRSRSMGNKSSADNNHSKNDVSSKVSSARMHASTGDRCHTGTLTGYPELLHLDTSTRKTCRIKFEDEMLAREQAMKYGKSANALPSSSPSTSHAQRNSNQRIHKNEFRLVSTARSVTDKSPKSIRTFTLAPCNLSVAGSQAEGEVETLKREHERKRKRNYDGKDNVPSKSNRPESRSDVSVDLAMCSEELYDLISSTIKEVKQSKTRSDEVRQPTNSLIKEIRSKQNNEYYGIDQLTENENAAGVGRQSDGLSKTSKSRKERNREESITRACRGESARDYDKLNSGEKRDATYEESDDKPRIHKKNALIERAKKELRSLLESVCDEKGTDHSETINASRKLKTSTDLLDFDENVKGDKHNVKITSPQRTHDYKKRHSISASSKYIAQDRRQYNCFADKRFDNNVTRHKTPKTDTDEMLKTMKQNKLNGSRRMCKQILREAFKSDFVEPQRNNPQNFKAKVRTPAKKYGPFTTSKPERLSGHSGKQCIPNSCLFDQEKIHGRSYRKENVSRSTERNKDNYEFGDVSSSHQWYSRYDEDSYDADGCPYSVGYDSIENKYTLCETDIGRSSKQHDSKNIQNPHFRGKCQPFLKQRHKVDLKKEKRNNHRFRINPRAPTCTGLLITNSSQEDISYVDKLNHRNGKRKPTSQGSKCSLIVVPNRHKSRSTKLKMSQSQRKLYETRLNLQPKPTKYDNAGINLASCKSARYNFAGLLDPDNLTQRDMKLLQMLAKVTHADQLEVNKPKRTEVQNIETNHKVRGSQLQHGDGRGMNRENESETGSTMTTLVSTRNRRTRNTTKQRRFKPRISPHKYLHQQTKQIKQIKHKKTYSTTNSIADNYKRDKASTNESEISPSGFSTRVFPSSSDQNVSTPKHFLPKANPTKLLYDPVESASDPLFSHKDIRPKKYPERKYAPSMTKYSDRHKEHFQSRYAPYTSKYRDGYHDDPHSVMTANESPPSVLFESEQVTLLEIIPTGAGPHEFKLCETRWPGYRNKMKTMGSNRKSVLPRVIGEVSDRASLVSSSVSLILLSATSDTTLPASTKHEHKSDVTGSYGSGEEEESINPDTTSAMWFPRAQVSADSERLPGVRRHAVIDRNRSPSVLVFNSLAHTGRDCQMPLRISGPTGALESSPASPCHKTHSRDSFRTADEHKENNIDPNEPPRNVQFPRQQQSYHLEELDERCHGDTGSKITVAANDDGLSSPDKKPKEEKECFLLKSEDGTYSAKLFYTYVSNVQCDQNNELESPIVTSPECKKIPSPVLQREDDSKVQIKRVSVPKREVEVQTVDKLHPFDQGSVNEINEVMCSKDSPNKTSGRAKRENGWVGPVYSAPGIPVQNIRGSHSRKGASARKTSVSVAAKTHAVDQRTYARNIRTCEPAPMSTSSNATKPKEPDSRTHANNARARGINTYEPDTRPHSPGTTQIVHEPNTKSHSPTKRTHVPDSKIHSSFTDTYETHTKTHVSDSMKRVSHIRTHVHDAVANEPVTRSTTSHEKYVRIVGPSSPQKYHFVSQIPVRLNLKMSGEAGDVDMHATPSIQSFSEVTTKGTSVKRLAWDRRDRRVNKNEDITQNKDLSKYQKQKNLQQKYTNQANQLIAEARSRLPISEIRTNGGNVRRSIVARSNAKPISQENTPVTTPSRRITPLNTPLGTLSQRINPLNAPHVIAPSNVHTRTSTPLNGSSRAITPFNARSRGVTPINTPSPTKMPCSDHKTSTPRHSNENNTWTNDLACSKFNSNNTWARTKDPSNRKKQSSSTTAHEETLDVIKPASISEFEKTVPTKTRRHPNLDYTFSNKSPAIPTVSLSRIPLLVSKTRTGTHEEHNMSCHFGERNYPSDAKENELDNNIATPILPINETSPNTNVSKTVDSSTAIDAKHECCLAHPSPYVQHVVDQQQTATCASSNNEHGDHRVLETQRITDRGSSISKRSPRLLQKQIKFGVRITSPPNRRELNGDNMCRLQHLEDYSQMSNTNTSTKSSHHQLTPHLTGCTTRSKRYGIETISPVFSINKKTKLNVGHRGETRVSPRERMRSGHLSNEISPDMSPDDYRHIQSGNQSRVCQSMNVRQLIPHRSQVDLGGHRMAEKNLKTLITALQRPHKSTLLLTKRRRGEGAPRLLTQKRSTMKNKRAQALGNFTCNAKQRTSTSLDNTYTASLKNDNLLKVSVTDNRKTVMTNDRNGMLRYDPNITFKTNRKGETKFYQTKPRKGGDNGRHRQSEIDKTVDDCLPTLRTELVVDDNDNGLLDYRDFKIPRGLTEMSSPLLTPESSVASSESVGTLDDVASMQDTHFVQDPQSLYVRHHNSPEKTEQIGISYTTCQTNGWLFGKPQTNGRSFEKPQTNGRTFEKPQTNGRTFEKPQTNGRTFEKPQTNGRVFERCRQFEKPLPNSQPIQKPQPNRRVFQKGREIEKPQLNCSPIENPPSNSRSFQKLQPNDQQSFVHHRPNDQQSVVHHRPNDQQSVVHHRPNDQQSVVHHRPNDQQSVVHHRPNDQQSVVHHRPNDNPFEKSPQTYGLASGDNNSPPLPGTNNDHNVPFWEGKKRRNFKLSKKTVRSCTVRSSAVARSLLSEAPEQDKFLAEPTGGANRVKAHQESIDFQNIVHFNRGLKVTIMRPPSSVLSKHEHESPSECELPSHHEIPRSL